MDPGQLPRNLLCYCVYNSSQNKDMVDAPDIKSEWKLWSIATFGKKSALARPVHT